MLREISSPKRTTGNFAAGPYCSWQRGAFQHPSQAQVSVLVGPTVASSRATLSERKAGQLKQGQTLLTTSSKTASNLLLLAPRAANMPCTVKAPSKRQGCRRQTASRGREKKTSPFHRFRRKAWVQKTIHSHLCAGLELGYSTEARAL